MLFLVCDFIWPLPYMCNGHATILKLKQNFFLVHALTYIVLSSFPFFVHCCQTLFSMHADLGKNKMNSEIELNNNISFYQIP